MNKLSAKINRVIAGNGIFLLETEVNEDLFKALIVSSSDEAFQVKEGDHVELIIKENAIILSKSEPGQIAISNVITCTVADIVNGELLSQVKLDYKDNKLNVVVLKASLEQLNINKDDKVFALIKASDILISN